jgi:hypothetical protein
MEEYFLIEPENADFVKGLAKKPASNSGNPVFILIFISIFCIAGLFVIGATIQTATTFAQLKFLSKETNGQFISQRESNSDGTTYYIKYNFSLDGKKFTNESMVKKETYIRFSQNQHKSDEPLRVIYYKNNPEISALEDPGISFTIFLAFFSVLWNAACYGLFFGIIYMTNKMKKLTRFGKIIDGKITECRGEKGEDDFLINGNFIFNSPISNQFINGKFNNQARNDLNKDNLPKLGTPVKILYMNDKTFEIL